MLIWLNYINRRKNVAKDVFWNDSFFDIVNSKIFFNRASDGPESFQPICSCSAQKPSEACTNCKFVREQSRASQKLLRNKISINVFILWKMRPIFKKCSWLITSNITHTYTLHTHIVCASSSRENRLNRLILLFN